MPRHRPTGALTTGIWDDHRLFQVYRPGVSPYSAFYRFDGKTVMRQQSGRTVVWDAYSANGGDILLQRDTNPVTTMVYAWGMEPGQLARQVGQTTAASVTTYEQCLPADAMGSVQSWGSSGNRPVRDAWGNVLAQATSEQKYDWLGGHGYWRENTPGLYYVRERWYDPAIGQWLSVDPVTTEPRYLYVRNQATTSVDPSGLQQIRNGIQNYQPKGPYVTNDRRTPIIPEELRKRIAKSIGYHVTAAVVRGIQSLEQGARDYFENQRNSAARPNPLTFSLITKLLRTVPGIKQYLDALNYLDTILATIQPLFESIRSYFDPIIRNAAPPSPRILTWDGPEYACGFMFGLMESILGLVPFTWIYDFAQLLVWMVEQQVTWEAIAELVPAAYKQFTDLFSVDVDMAWFDRGKLAAILLVSLALLILLIVFAPEIIPQLAARGSRSIGMGAIQTWGSLGLRIGP